MIQPFSKEIVAWLGERLEGDIAELEALESRARSGTKASEKRQLDLVAKRQRLAALSSISSFNYSPSQTSVSPDGLAHAEVLQIAAHLLSSKPLLQKILVGRYPFLLIDEVQDTNAGLMDAILLVQAANAANFCVGLFGDTMQRIYSDGKTDLEGTIGADWRRPALETNYRSSRRVVELINAIRSETDGRQQLAASSRPGTARLYIEPALDADHARFESGVRSEMAEATGDAEWETMTSVKTLILEHALAARRHGFQQLFDALGSDPALRKTVVSRDSDSSEIIKFIRSVFLPLMQSIQSEDNLATEQILRVHSPILDAGGHVEDEPYPKMVSLVRQAVADVRSAINGPDQSIRELLAAVHHSNALT